MTDFFEALDHQLRAAARTRRRPLPVRAAAALALAVPVAAGLAVGALLIAGHHRHERFGTTARPPAPGRLPTGADEQRRAAELMAVFRRPRTAADAIPEHFGSKVPERVIRDYRAGRANSRLVGTSHGFSVYLYVPPFDATTPPVRGREYGICLWATFKRRGAGGGCGIIDDQFASGRRPPGQLIGGRRLGFYLPVFVFPDDIRSATLHLVDGRTVTAPVRNNVTFTSTRVAVRVIRWRDTDGKLHGVALHAPTGK